MKNAAIAVFLGGLLVLTLSAQDSAARPEPPTVAVGTFDSRAVLMAYVSSDDFSDYVSAQKAEIARALDRAREAGDHELVADLEALGPAMQRRIHRKGFGTAPVDDIMARIEERLPRIAEEAGVGVIVSKWALDFRHPTAEFVDVTDRLVAEFGPDEDTLKGIAQLLLTDPVPLDQLRDHD